jgi:hypothetical protein
MKLSALWRVRRARREEGDQQRKLCRPLIMLPNNDARFTKWKSYTDPIYRHRG